MSFTERCASVCIMKVSSHKPQFNAKPHNFLNSNQIKNLNDCIMMSIIRDTPIICALMEKWKKVYLFFEVFGSQQVYEYLTTKKKFLKSTLRLYLQRPRLVSKFSFNTQIACFNKLFKYVYTWILIGFPQKKRITIIIIMYIEKEFNEFGVSDYLKLNTANCTPDIYKIDRSSV